MPGLSRRQLCAGTALVGASWGLVGCAPGSEGGPLPSTPEPPRTAPVPEDSLTLARLLPLVGTTFTLESEDGHAHAVALRAINDRSATRGTPGRRGESFTLLFQGSGDNAPALAQATYRTQHPALGSFRMFLVPSGRPASGPRRYAATFSHLAG
jgi:hypothetical protein